MDNIFAHTESTYPLPGYVSLNKRNGKYYLSVRAQGQQYAQELELPFMEVLKLGNACHSILDMNGD